jgi:hypothetical protein
MISESIEIASVLAVSIFAYGLIAGAMDFDSRKKARSFAHVFIYSYFLVMSNALMLIL